MEFSDVLFIACVIYLSANYTVHHDSETSARGFHATGLVCGVGLLVMTVVDLVARWI